MHASMDIPMKHPLKIVFSPGVTLDYICDFGSSTELIITHVSNVERSPGKSSNIFILTRNEAPVFECEACNGKPAVVMCGTCMHEGNSFIFCRDCAEKHSCEDVYFLKILNSPRTGACGYGEEFDSDTE